LEREQAWELVCRYTQSPGLRRHMLATEAAMRAYAARFGGDTERWGLAGLLHDFDYEQYPDVAVEGHPVVGARLLEEMSAPDDVVRAMLAHAAEITGVHPESLMEKTLVAVDELTGFVIAVTLVRPSGSIHDVKVSSIRKKWKDRAFAAPVDRQAIEAAATAIGMPLDEHIEVVLKAMQAEAEALGLVGEIAD
jgi:putative nucleotidyltransferase with HDIG domain